MKLLLDHADSPYIRAIGFLYLRYAGEPTSVYKWIEPYLYDDEPIQARASSAKQHGSTETMGEYVRRLFTDKNYCGTILPRHPIQIEREIQVKLLQAEKIEERAKKHASDSRTMSYFQKVGAKVMALYGDEENPIQWYEAVVDRVITTNPETQQRLRHPQFIVHFPEYGNTETVTLGEIEMMGASLDKVSDPTGRGGYSDRDHNRASYNERSGDDRLGAGRGDHDRGYKDGGQNRGYSQNRDRGYGGRGRDQYHGQRDDSWQRGGYRRPSAAAASITNESDLYEEVRRRERETVTSSSRHAIARRPPTTKASLSVSANDGPHRRTHPPNASPPRAKREEQEPSSSVDSGAVNPPAAKKRTAEELAMIEAKKRKLMAKYG